MIDSSYERLFIFLDEQVPGLAHMKAFDPYEFAQEYNDELALELGLVPLSDCAYFPDMKKRWHPAGIGLRTLRGLIAYYEAWAAKGGRVIGLGLIVQDDDKIRVLGQVAAVLETADVWDRKFYMLAR